MAIRDNAQLRKGIGSEGSGAPTVHEIFTKVNNAKDKTQKIAMVLILKSNLIYLMAIHLTLQMRHLLVLNTQV